MSFRSAVQSTPSLQAALKPGLRALGSNSSKIKSNDPGKCEGSIDIDTTVRAQYPNSSRWDYALGYGGKTYFVEVHSAKTDEVSSVLNKLQWLKDFLVRDVPELNKEPRSFHWIASGKVAILPSSSQARQLAQKGLRVAGQLTLP
ncbi:hypothetical protein [Leptolyngbya sp. PCC 6406]|uniref:hypothetical protein n=1 Tax=Leptolyngbya sp. PCC 6406 TaxID=1173264 RepID=UPI0002AC4D4D|nr:hypothetical protein [Leptolyngbya sp. PCC 6406]